MFGGLGKRKNDGSEEPLNWDEEGVFAPQISEEDFRNLPTADTQIGDEDSVAHKNIDDALEKAKRGEPLTKQEAEALKFLLTEQGHLEEEQPSDSRGYSSRYAGKFDRGEAIFTKWETEKILRLISEENYKAEEKIVDAIENAFKRNSFSTVINRMRISLGQLFEFYLKHFLFDRNILVHMNTQGRVDAAEILLEEIPHLAFINERFASIFTQTGLHLTEKFPFIIFNKRIKSQIDPRFVSSIFQSYVSSYINTPKQDDFERKYRHVLGDFISRAIGVFENPQVLMSDTYLKTLKESPNFISINYFLRIILGGDYKTFINRGASEESTGSSTTKSDKWEDNYRSYYQFLNDPDTGDDTAPFFETKSRSTRRYRKFDQRMIYTIDRMDDDELLFHITELRQRYAIDRNALDPLFHILVEYFKRHPNQTNIEREINAIRAKDDTLELLYKLQYEHEIEYIKRLGREA